MEILRSRIMLLLLTCTMTVSLIGCGSSSAETSQKKDDTSKQESTSEDKDNDEQGIKVDKKLLTVDVTLPASYFEEDDNDEKITQEKLDETVKEDSGIISAKLKKDGSVKYTMTKAKQKEMLDEIEKEIKKGCKELLEEDDVSYTDISYNKDYTEFTVKTTAEKEIGLFDSMYVMVFYGYGVYYNALAGNDFDDIIVVFVNDKTGKEVERASYKAFMEESEEDKE